VTSFDRLLRPEFASGKATHLQEGFVMGWVPGIITSLEDPGGLQRIKCTCNLIDSSTNLPNAEDAMVWVLKGFTTNAIPGGSEVPLEVGCQVALLPMFGDPRQMLLLGCLNSQIDKPHPIFSRTEGVYGSVTRQEVFDISNDQEQSNIKAYPHGVVQAVTKDGNVIAQTQGGASQVLKQDGTILTQNPKAGFTLDQKGEIIHSVESGAKSVLDSQGRVQIENAFGGKLLLMNNQSKLTGPPTSLSGLMGQVKGLGGILGKATSVLKSLKGLSFDPATIAATITEGSGLLQSLGSAAGSLSGGGGIMGALSNLPISEFILATQPQLAIAASLDLPSLAGSLSQLVQGKASIRDIVGDIAQKALERSLPINIPGVTSLVSSLYHNPERLVESAVSLFVPGGFSEIENLAGMGILQAIPAIEQSLSAISFRKNNSNVNDLPQDSIASLLDSLRSHFTPDLQSLISESVVRAAIDDDDPLAYLIAKLQISQIENLQQTFVEIQPLLDKVTAAQGVFQSLTDENYHQLFNVADDEISNMIIGDLAINLFGDIEVGDLDFGKLLGDFNPTSVDLTNLDARAILGEDLLNQEIDLTSLGIPNSITLGSLLGGIDIGVIDLPTLLQAPITDILNFSDIKINDIFENTKLKDVAQLDIASATLEKLLAGVSLPHINIKEFLNKDNLAEIPLTQMFGDVVDKNLTLKDAIEVSNLDEVSLKDIQLSTLINNDLTELDPKSLNLGIKPEVSPEQLAQLAAAALAPLTQKLDKSLNSSLQSTNKAINSIPSLGNGSKLELGQVGGQLISAYGAHRVFANIAGAGVSTPYGSFSLGSGGGGMFSIASMAMAVVEKLSSKAAGIFLSPKSGIILAETENHANPDQWSFEEAKIQLHNGGIHLQSAGGTHTIDVLPTGIFLNGIEILPYFNRYNQFLSRLDVLENMMSTLTT